METSNKIMILIHGGAWDVPEAVHQPTREGVRDAAVIGYRWKINFLKLNETSGEKILVCNCASINHNLGARSSIYCTPLVGALMKAFTRFPDMYISKGKFARPNFQEYLLEVASESPRFGLTFQECRTANWQTKWAIQNRLKFYRHEYLKLITLVHCYHNIM